MDNPEHRLYGQSDLEADTSDTGALRKLAAALPGNTVWLTSHLRRTRQTAEAVRPHYESLGNDAPPIAELPEIAEQDFGTWQGMTVGELKIHLGAAFAAFWRAPGEAEPPGGESFAQVIERVAGAIGHLGHAHSGRDIIAFAHGGGAFPATIGRIEQGFNARPDLCAVDNDVNPRDYLDKIYLDTLVFDPLMLDYLLRLMGPERLALGSDYPFPLGELEPGRLIESTVSDEDVKARLLHGTALDWLNLEKERFL